VTFKDLKKRVSITHEAEQQSGLFNRLDNKPFWIWDKEQHKQTDLAREIVALTISLDYLKKIT
jgi:hypothetical protein